MAEILIGATVAGVQIGCVWALVAMGLTLIFGIIRVINFAHGSMLMLFMYLGYYLWRLWGIDPYLSMIITAPVAFVFGYAVQHFLIYPMFAREKAFVVEPLGVLVLMLAFDLILANVALIAFEPLAKTVKVTYASKVIEWGFLTLNVPRLIVVLIALLLTFGVSQLMNRTELGNTIRAVGQSREAAAICGINVHHVYAVTFGLGCAITAFGGCALLPFQYVAPGMGMPFLLRAFIVVALGGLGSLRGALLGGIIIGVVESVAGQFVPAVTSVVISLIIFLAIIRFRPKGLMGLIEV